MKRILIAVFFCLVMAATALAESDPVTKFTDTFVSYFKPLSGGIIRVEGNNVVLSVTEKDAVKPGMRMKVLREGAPFVHPVTKELIGKIESTIGKVEVKTVSPDAITGVMLEGEAKEGDKVRLSDTKMRIFFCQDKSVDWYLGDEYYRKVKATGRMEMVDTALETGEETKVLEEARKSGSDVALILTARQDEKGTLLRERVLWVSDGSRLIDNEVTISGAFAKDLKFGEDLFIPSMGDAVLTYSLPFGAKMISTGDYDGDGRQEIVLSTGSNIRVYLPGADLKPLWELKGSASDEFIWIDSIDLNRNGKDELVLTSMKGDEVVSYIYELTDNDFKKLMQGNYFLRKVGGGLCGQAYSSSDGFSGDVFSLVWSGEYRRGEKIPLPAGVNLYDYVILEGIAKESILFAYDDKGFLNLYGEKGTRLWKSSSNTGGFITTTKKKTTVSYQDSGEWSVKDRLISRQREVLVVERVPMAEVVRGVGYKSSRIRRYWWNGFAMEDTILIDGVKGTIFDYALAGDKIAVLASPILGIKFENILKGENPLGKALYLYSLKGR